MTATVAQLAARVLRKTGLSPIALADRPDDGSVIAVGVIAARALRSLGVNPVAEADSIATTGTATFETIALRVLLRLAVVEAGESPTSDDMDLAEAQVSSLHQDLTHFNLVSWAANAVPEAFTELYVIMTAHLLAPAFGLPLDQVGYDAARQRMASQHLSGLNGQSLAEDEINAAHQSLNALGYVEWANDEIPEAVSSYYAQMAAVRLSPAYGKTASEDVYQASVGAVRRFCMSGAKGQAIAEEKVWAVHASLASRGIARWDLMAIPTQAEEPYVMMAAELTAPEVGQPLLSGMWDAGERMIRRMIAVPSARGPVRAVYY